MRYHGISPDSQPLSNGRRIGSNLNWKTYKEDEEEAIVMEEIINGGGTGPIGGNISRLRSPTTKKDNHHSNNNGIESSSNNNEDVLLQWGQRKRSRCSRGVVSLITDDSSSSPDVQLLQLNKVPRTSSTHQNLNDANTNGTIHPPLPSSSNVSLKGPKNKHSSRIVSSSVSLVRGSQEQSSGGDANRVVPSRSRVTVKKSPSRDKKITPLSSRQSPPTTTKADTLLHLKSHPEAMSIDSKRVIHDANNGIPTSNVGGEKMNGVVEVHEWPRIYIALSRKEKEEDFMAMKGSKLPHRPKKRPKATDRMLQYCYPGMWLSDLTRGRYEVREKKSTKKQKQKGLKGMESIESDSE